ncbi:MAG: type II secretion system F family protein [Ottowia sp.]|nr:type II secretion system F family protein [Ottowia sp.]
MSINSSALQTWFASALFGVSAGICIYLTIYLGKTWQLRQRTRNRPKIIEQQFADAMLIISASLRAGITLQNALNQFGQTAPSPLREELLSVIRDQRFGTDITHALDNLAKRLSTPTIGIAIAMMQIGHSSGGPLAPALEQIAQTMHNQHMIEDKIHVLTAQGRLQGHILSALPIFLLLALQWIDPQMMQALWHTQEGWIALSTIVLLEILGMHAIRRITRPTT